MKRVLFIIAAFSTLLVSCKQVGPIDNPDPAKVRIDPVITKATDVDFENGDVIGISIVRSNGVYAENAPLTYNGLEFSGDLCWYLEPQDPSEIVAYYPYDASGVPDTFTVKTDQSAGISSSDFITASKSDVYPSFNSVSLAFKHRLTKIALTLANLSEKKIAKVELDGLTPVARVNVKDGSVEADTIAAKVAINTCQVAVDTFWKAIVVPQTAQMNLKVTLADGKVLVQKLAEITMEPSTQYAISAVVYNDNVKIITSGQIEPWLNGGDIPGTDDPDEPDVPVYEEFDGYFVYYGERYNFVKMADGNTWMTENLRYVPEGKTVSSDPTEAAGIWYPASNASKTADPSLVATKGLLYDSATAFGVKEITEENAAGFEGCQGICPDGWHIPTVEETVGLVGKCSNGDLDNPKAPYFDSNVGGAPISALDADGFNWTFVGIRNKTGVTANPSYTALEYNGEFGSMSYVLGSSLYKVSYNKDTGVMSNIQYYSLMSTYNASYERITVAYSGFLMGCSVRCVRQ